MGQPFYQIRPLVDRGQVTVFSANFALYGDLSRRVMATLRSLVPGIEVYSIDEAFFDLRGMASPRNWPSSIRASTAAVTCTGRRTSRRFCGNSR